MYRDDMNERMFRERGTNEDRERDVNKQMNKRINKRTNKRTNERMNGRACKECRAMYLCRSRGLRYI